jgi:hypothetical protein
MNKSQFCIGWIGPPGHIFFQCIEPSIFFPPLMAPPCPTFFLFCFQGMIAGHAYYFLEDVYPRMTARRPLKTPSFIKAIFADEPVVVARPVNVPFAPPPAEDVAQD